MAVCLPRVPSSHEEKQSGDVTEEVQDRLEVNPCYYHNYGLDAFAHFETILNSLFQNQKLGETENVFMINEMKFIITK